MRSAMRLVMPLLLAAAPLGAQTAAGDLARLSFMTGCWTGPTTVPAGASVIEERFTAPSENVMLGTARYLARSGRTLFFEFKLLRADSTGTWLVPYPDGRVIERPFRLTRLSGDTALFESPEHPYPKRIRYHREWTGALVVRVDAGLADSAPHTFSMRPTICSSIPDAFATGHGFEPRDQRGSGTTELIVFETLHGLFLGLAVPMMLDAEEPAPYGLGLLLGGPVGLMLSRAYAQAHHPSSGQARAIVWGGTWGALSSLFLYQAFEEQPTASGAFGSLAAGLIGGTLFGGYVARNPISGGDGSMVIHSTIWGGWVGLAVSVMAAGENGGEVWLPMLIGGNAALLAASMAARKVDMSSGRVWIITASGLAGLVAGVGIDILVQPDDAVLGMGIPLVTSLAGLAGGLAATRDYDANRISAGPARLGPLLAVRNGRARFGVPLPEPALVPRDDGASRRWVPGLRLRLFDLRH